MIFIDSHVHIYDCFEVDLLLDSALSNFQTAASHHNTTGQPSFYVLLLTERENDNWFQRTLATVAARDQENGSISENWCATKAEDPDSLMVFRRDSADNRMYVVAGRQVVTKEKIEVLSLYSQEGIRDGIPLAETVNTIEQQNSIAVLPWGVGKWIGARGKAIETFLSAHKTGGLYLGDNGGRPSVWPTPTLFRLAEKKGVAVLPGTDALPLKGEACRIGSFGFFLNDALSPEEDPTSYLKKTLLSQEQAIVPFGRLQKNSLFLSNQLRLRFLS
jgi:hypothetical protein